MCINNPDTNYPTRPEIWAQLYAATAEQLAQATLLASVTKYLIVTCRILCCMIVYGIRFSESLKIEW